jgi:hypothetical protein
MQTPGRENRRLLALVSPERLRRVLRGMLFGSRILNRLRHPRAVAISQIKSV